MDQHWVDRTSWPVQASTFTSESHTSGYKAYEDDIELPVRRRKDQKDNQFNIASGTTLDQTQDGSVLQPRKITKSFNVATRPFGLNLSITETTKYPQKPTYFAVSSEFSRQPDIVLHAEDKNGSRMAIAHFRFSRHIRMGFGSETLVDEEFVWEEMKNTSTWLGHWRYEFEYNIPPDQGDFSWDVGPNAGRVRKKFVWLRTRDEIDGVKGMVETHVGWRNYKLVEQDSGRVLAVMLMSMFTGCSYKGAINLHEDLSKEMEVMVIMTAICICDKGERRIRHYACGGGGGGS